MQENAVCRKIGLRKCARPSRFYLHFQHIRSFHFDALWPVTYRTVGRLAAAGRKHPSCSPALVADMDENLRVTAPVDPWRTALAQTIEQQRRRVGERIAGQRERLKELEARIAAQLGEATQQISQQHEAVRAKEQSLTGREQELQRQRRHTAQQIRAKKKELATEADLQRAQATASGAGQDAQLQARLSELQSKYDRLREDLEAREGQRNEATHRLAELKTQLEGRQHELKQQQAAVEQAQRKQAELEADRGRLQADLHRHQEDGKQLQAAREELERVRRESHEQIERLRADQGKSQDAQVQSLHQQLDDLRKKLGEADEKAKQVGAGGQASAAELAKLRDENKQLEQWLAEAEAKAKQGGTGGGQEMEDLRRRFEMAVQDVRELKTKNAELTEQLSKARQGGPAPSAGGGQGGDWESLKQKLLADLESDFDEKDDAQKADKLTVQGAIKITDQVVASKDEEIRELRRVLESQSQQVGDVAVGAAAFTQLLDADELIRQERESLKRLQDSLREQLRQAEVDISVERAKLARERAELDEKIRGLEAEKANLPAGGHDAGEKGKKGGGRKWLARLGLGDGKDE